MTNLKIVSFPNRILATRGEQVTKFDAELAQLSEDMFDAMYAARGVGLAAQQVGLALMLFVMDCEGTKLAAANPEIVFRDGEQSDEEACLSLRSIGAQLKRAQTARIRAQNIEGEWFEFEGSGLTARCLQHETDHLLGTLFVDHLSPLKRDMLLRRYKKSLRNDE